MDEITIIRNIGILSRTFVSALSKAMSASDLSFSESIFLINIGENEGVNQDTIASNLAIDKAAVARSVKSLEQKNFLLAKKSETDKRSKQLYLTAKGQIIYQQVLKLHLSWAKEVLSPLTNKEIHDFSQMIDLLGDQAKQAL
ncbi:MarR family transcriptional regulator [Eubacteriaceae bacterium ES2]|nr:MarR family transcriptional regulator [Eubacteriaceae bacterium ES2]